MSADSITATHPIFRATAEPPANFRPLLPPVEKRASRRRLQAIPSPKLSKLQQTRRFLDQPYEFLRSVRRECGDLFRIDVFGMGSMTFVCNTELLQELFRKGEDEVLAGAIRGKAVAPLIGDQGSVALDGEEFLRRRKATMPYFSGHRIRRYVPLIRWWTEEAIAHWRVGETFPLVPDLNILSRRAVERILLGPLDRPATARLVQKLDEFLDAVTHPAVWTPPLRLNLGRRSPWGRFVHLREEVLDQLHRVIERRIEQREVAASESQASMDVLGSLLAARLSDDPRQERDLVAAEIMALLFGGTESISKAVAWTLLGVLSDRDVVERVRAEIDERLGLNPIGAEDLTELKYLQAVAYEGMRHHPAGPFAGPRITTQDTALGEFHVPKGTVISQCVSELGRCSLFPDPDRFNPDNFYDRNVRLKDWIPFGGGSRVCTGMGLALAAAPLIIGTILHNTELELGPGSTKPRKAGFVFQPENGLKVRLIAKRSSFLS